jgi:hypothetical protein
MISERLDDLRRFYDILIHRCHGNRPFVGGFPEHRYMLYAAMKPNTMVGHHGSTAAHHIRVASKAELKSRILAYLDGINTEPVVHTWTYKIGEAA